MGIRNDTRTDFAAALTAWRKANPTATRAQVRRYVAALTDAGQEWLAKRDAQDAAATTGFAASRTAQFATYVAALPDVTLDAVDPAE